MTDNDCRADLYVRLRTHNPDPSWQTVFDEAALEIDRLMKEKQDLRSAARNYAREVKEGLDELKRTLEEKA
jgi:hypothetical protein